jgi:hypothetical protein
VERRIMGTQRTLLLYMLANQQVIDLRMAAPNVSHTSATAGIWKWYEDELWKATEVRDALAKKLRGKNK